MATAAGSETLAARPSASAEKLWVIIPAHNEAATLPLCIRSLVNQDFPGRLQIIVAVNGSTDGSAQLARELAGDVGARGHRLRVIELQQASKAAALNAADALADQGPRVYIDADIQLSPGALSAVAAELTGTTGIHLSAPRLSVAAPRSRISACYSEIWKRLPYVQDEVMGCGFYGVSEAGRQRWGLFPEIISDDKFVRLHFADHERRVTPTAAFQIRLPEGFAELVKVRGRWCRGNRDLKRGFPHLAVHDKPRIRPAIQFLARTPRLWSRLPVFLLVWLCGECLALARLRTGNRRWERATAARMHPAVWQASQQ